MRNIKSVKKYRAALLLTIGMLHASGCASTELEQRSFPLAVGIDLQEEDYEVIAREASEEDVFRREAGKTPDLVVSYDFPDLAQISEKGKTVDTAMGLSLEGADMYHVEKSYENNTNRMLDYNHIKAMVLGERLLSDAKSLRNLLRNLEQEENAARNTTLFVANGSAAEILSLTEETEGSMGTYLEQMMESQKDFRQKKIATVGSLMNQWHNQNELLLLPVLSEKGNRPAVSGYAVISNFDYVGIITVEEAMQIFLCQNLIETFICELNQEEAAEISDMRVSVSVADDRENPTVSVSVFGKGKMKAGQASSMGQEYQIEQRMEKRLMTKLQETAQKLQQEYGIDITNSYVSLGGYNRKLYQKYKNQPETYNQSVHHLFEVDIDILNWE